MSSLDTSNASMDNTATSSDATSSTTPNDNLVASTPGDSNSGAQINTDTITPSTTGIPDTTSPQPTIDSSDVTPTDDTLQPLSDPSLDTPIPTVTLNSPPVRNTVSRISSHNTSDERVLNILHQTPLAPMTLLSTTIVNETNSVNDTSTEIPGFNSSFPLIPPSLFHSVAPKNTTSNFNGVDANGQFEQSLQNTDPVNNTPIIIGVSVGGLLLIIIGGMLLYWRKQKSERRRLMDPYGNPYAVERKGTHKNAYSY